MRKDWWPCRRKVGTKRKERRSALTWKGGLYTSRPRNRCKEDQRRLLLAASPNRWEHGHDDNEGFNNAKQHLLRAC
jgi:hypothetical protein